jgi:CRISPR/Cas system CSM-associated protein Csm2 small subunit
MYEKKVMKRENWWKKQLRKFFHENQEKKINNVNEWNDVLNQKCLKLDSIKSYSKVCMNSGYPEG